MPFELRQRKHIEAQLRKIARRQLGNTAGALGSVKGSRLRTAVHEARKSVKKVRAVKAFLEEAGADLPRKDQKRLKAAAAALSRVRDSAAIVETFDRLRRRYPKQLSEHTYGILRRGLINARDRVEARARRDGVIGDAAARLEKTRASAKRWTLPSLDVSDMAAVITDSYRRSRKAMARAQATKRSASVHRWRKNLKLLWYQLRLAQPLAAIAPLIVDLKRLETELGDDHNLVVLAATLRGCRDLRAMRAEIRQIDRLAGRMRQGLRRRAFTLGRRLHGQKPKAFARRLRATVEPARRSRATAA